MRGTLIALALALFAGCYTEADVGGGAYVAGGPGVYAEPGLVEVSPGVQVIADYDYPVFYTGGLYWRQFGGVWYSSTVYTGGWGVAYNVPVGIRGIARPEAYVHYNAGVGYRGAAYNRGVGYNRGVAYNRPAAGPAYRGPVYHPAAPAAARPAYHAPAATHTTFHGRR